LAELSAGFCILRNLRRNYRKAKLKIKVIAETEFVDQWKSKEASAKIAKFRNRNYCKANAAMAFVTSLKKPTRMCAREIA